MTAGFWVGPDSGPDTFGLVSMLGGGGEGEVWKAVLPLSEGGRRTVAVKIMRADAEGSAQWDKVGHLLRSLSHPGLVRVTDVFAGAGMHRAGEPGVGEFRYVVMDYVAGTSLADWVVENPDTPPSARLRLLRMIAAALDDMHAGTATEVPVAHGDVKPANIVVGPDGGAVLVDLGLTRLADGAGIAGHSAPYAAPEIRVAGALPTPEADRYAFAVTTAQALTGAQPPLGTDGWLDVDALEGQLRRHPATERRHALVQQIMTLLAAPAEARPLSLRTWLDGAAESLSRITGPGQSGRVPVTVLGPEAGDPRGVRTWVPGPGGYTLPTPLPPTAGPSGAGGSHAAALRRRSRAVLTVLVLATLLAAGVVALTRPQVANAVDTRPIAGPRLTVTATPLPTPLSMPVPATGAVLAPVADGGPAPVQSPRPIRPAPVLLPAPGPQPVPDPQPVPVPPPPPQPPLQITTSSLPDAQVGVAYRFLLEATGGVPRDNWKPIDGALPAGISLAQFGHLLGTPTAAGPATFTVEVDDQAGGSDSQEFTLTVDPAPEPVPPTPPQPGDLNGDGQVDCADKAILSAQDGQSGTGLSADINGDGTVDATDLGIMMSNWTGATTSC